MNLPGIIFISLSLPFAVIQLLVWLRRWRCRRTPIAETPIHVSKLCMLADLFVGVGLLLTWIISLIQEVNSTWGPDQRGMIACFALFLAWIYHTLHLLASLCFWTCTTRQQHICRHCGHRPESVLGGHTAATAVGRDSDEATVYDESAEQDAEHAMLLKVDAEA